MKVEALSKDLFANKILNLKRTGVHIMPRAIPCTSSSDPLYGRVSLGAIALLVVGALNLGGLL